MISRRSLLLALAAAPRPNILLILADDLGWGDLGCYGARDIRTPHLDALAQQGIRYTQFYANAPECTPSRTALLTGRYPHRVGGLECAIGVGNVGRYDEAIWLQERGELGLPAAEASLGQMLRRAGYQTACIGKWHLGHAPKFSALRHGFEHYFGVIGGNADYFTHREEGGAAALYEGEKPADRPASRSSSTCRSRRRIPRFKDRAVKADGPATRPWWSGWITTSASWWRRCRRRQS